MVASLTRDAGRHCGLDCQLHVAGEKAKAPGEQATWLCSIRPCSEFRFEPPAVLPRRGLHDHKGEDLKRFWGPKPLNRSCVISIGNKPVCRETDWLFPPKVATWHTGHVQKKPVVCKCREKLAPHQRPRSPDPLKPFQPFSRPRFFLSNWFLFLPLSTSCQILFYCSAKQTQTNKKKKHLNPPSR